MLRFNLFFRRVSFDNTYNGKVCALRRALDESEAKVATQNKALTEFKSETVPLLQGQLNVTNSQLKSVRVVAHGLLRLYY